MYSNWALKLYYQKKIEFLKEQIQKYELQISEL